MTVDKTVVFYYIMFIIVRNQMTFEQLHSLLVNDFHMEVSNYEKYYNEHMKPGSKKYEIFKGYSAERSTYSITNLFMIVTKKEESEPVVILVCPTDDLKCIKLNDIEDNDVRTLYNLRSIIIQKQKELDKANLDLLHFKGIKWIDSEEYVK